MRLYRLRSCESCRAWNHEEEVRLESVGLRSNLSMTRLANLRWESLRYGRLTESADLTSST
eukprot:824134-Amphidinium_carterae.1